MDNFTLENFLHFMDTEFDEDYFYSNSMNICMKCPIGQFCTYLFGDKFTGAGYDLITFKDETAEEIPYWASQVAHYCTVSFPSVYYIKYIAEVS